ncbi:MAG: arylsulfatase [Marinilabiliaceae bacterium]|jgi:arylsulfatase|nr:arylsulfatase [Marinilabiliaceae bacterium]
MKLFPGLFLVACILLSSCSKTGENKSPNILIIMADDLGYSDLGCYGGEISTPNLDRLAGNGIMFTEFYNSARCCPSRASVLTGLYPHQAGIGSFVGKPRGTHGYTGSLTPNAVTIAEVLQNSGYRTFGVGKWHVNHPGPTERGFEEFYGFLDDYGIDGWEPKWMQRYPEGRPERQYGEGEFFATNVITDYAIDFLDLARETPGKPWFMYLAYQAVHFPLQAPAEDIERYEGSYDVGWDTIRARRYERMKELGVINPGISLSERSLIPEPRLAERNQVPGDGIHNPPWNILSSERQADLAKRMAVYGAMLDNMDQNIGRVINDLEEKGELDNTLIIFLSDNGACAEWDPYGFEYPGYNDRVAGGTPGHPSNVYTGMALDQLGGPDGPLFSYGSGWSNVCNTPFTLYKQYTHEGGISSPFIIHWPERIREHDIFTERYAHITDIMATCVDVAGAEYPEIYKGNNITPMEGISIFETLEGNVDAQRLLTFEHSGHPAIRVGDWKLVSSDRAMTKEGLSDELGYELYNIADDRSETINLADKYPDKVVELKELMVSEFYRTKVLPRPFN